MPTSDQKFFKKLKEAQASFPLLRSSQGGRLECGQEGRGLPACDVWTVQRQPGIGSRLDPHRLLPKQVAPEITSCRNCLRREAL